MDTCLLLCHKLFLKSSRIPPLTITQDQAIIHSFPGMDATALSSLSITAPRLLSTATKTPPDVCLRSCILVGVPCRVGCKSPSLRGFYVELLFHLLSSHPVLNSKEDVDRTLQSSHVLPLRAPRRFIHSTGYTSTFSAVFASRFSLSFFLFPENFFCPSFRPNCFLPFPCPV